MSSSQTRSSRGQRLYHCGQMEGKYGTEGRQEHQIQIIASIAGGREEERRVGQLVGDWESPTTGGAALSPNIQWLYGSI